MGAIKGLTENEARRRRQRGEGNEVRFPTSRSYAEIVRTNVVNLFNVILVTIGGLLIALGRINDALISIGPLFLANIGIRTAQEIYAKRKLDQITIANRSTVTVIRDSQEKMIDPADLVKGDILRARAGDQIMADGTIIGESQLELDESLLSGESDLVSKRAGDTLLSGSVCVAGDGFYQAERVGAESFASQLTSTARKLESVTTPLQRKIDVTVRVIILVVTLISLVILVAAIIEGLSVLRLVQISAVLTDVPYGLFFMTIVAYALGAVVIARRGAVVQEANAIESLSSIDVLCMDKTGTLTANRLRYASLRPLGDRSQAEIEELLARFAVSASTVNRTSEAITAGLIGERREPVDEVPFASSRRWSALAFEQDERGQGGAYALGASEALSPYFPSDATAPDGALITGVRALSEQGLRVLVFAYNPDLAAVHDKHGQPFLPALTPLAIVGLADELRPEASDTIAAFQRLGIQIKIISGDAPETVATLARQAGVNGNIKSVSGPELERMSDREFAEAASSATVFGRIAPRQKEQLIEALIKQGHRVAMIGDGINDVLAVKKAQLGIAMQSGSNATRNVANMVLLGDSFAALHPALQEGKRIIAGVTHAMCLFLARIAVAALVIVAISILGLGFPFEPAHVALTYLTAGIPFLSDFVGQVRRRRRRSLLEVDPLRDTPLQS
jgi:cation-transporting ATPase E